MKIFCVGVHLSKRIATTYLGFSSYDFCYVKATTANEAEVKAKVHYENKYQLTVTCTDVAVPIDQDPENYTGLDNLLE